MIPRLWLVTDRRLAPDLPSAVRRALTLLPGPDCAVVLREKELPARELLALARELRSVTRDYGTRLVVSGRVDVAVAAEADGVHLGFEAPPAEAIRRVVGPSLLVGVSVHGEERAPAAADYAFLSPVFATTSKPGAAALGLDGLRRGVQRSPVAIVALGGIDATRIAGCLGAGASGVALRSGWLGADEAGLAATGREILSARGGLAVAAAVTRH